VTGLRVRRAWAGALLIAMATAACAQDNGSGSTSTGNVDLRGICPSTIVVQTSWWPRAEYGAFYRLLGRAPKVDAAKKWVNAPLVAAGQETGIRVEIRAGGQAVAFQQVSQLIYFDRSITFGTVATDEQVQNAATQPTLAVFAPMDVNPQVLMWDPLTFPEFHTIADIGQTDASVLHSRGATYVEFLVGAGVLRGSQVVDGYDGSPARFLAAGGRIVQQGYLTNEPYAYEHELPQWHRPLAYALLHDAGYPIYPETLAMRAEDKAKLMPCLTKLVPILQQATVDYAADPEPTNTRISQLVDQYGGPPYPGRRAAWAVNTMRSEGILSNGVHTPDTLGDFAPERVQRSIDALAPVLTGQAKPVPRGLTPDDLVTNEFIAPGVGLDPAPNPRP
jgi:hypothetical protein